MVEYACLSKGDPCMSLGSPRKQGGRGLTKAAADAPRHKLAHVNNEVLSQVDIARGVNEEWLQSLYDKDATAIRNGNVVVLSWRVQQDLQRQPKLVGPGPACHPCAMSMQVIRMHLTMVSMHCCSQRHVIANSCGYQHQNRCNVHIVTYVLRCGHPQE